MAALLSPLLQEMKSSTDDQHPHVTKSMTQSTKSQVAVSYSWKEESNGTNQGSVERFCKALEAAGLGVIRDTQRLKHGECISEFMRTIGASDFLCVFLSDAYLKSPNCMYELLVAWQRSKDNPKEFRDRVKVWVMPGATGIHKLENRLQFLDHWLAEKQRVEPLIAKYSTQGLSGASLDEFRRIQSIGAEVESMLQFFADTLSPGTEDEYQTWIKQHLPHSTEVGRQAELAEVYEHTVKEMEGLLNRCPVLRQYLSDSTTGLICQDSSGWRLVDAARARQFDVLLHLSKMANGLSTYKASPGDWKALADFTGGLVVLSINRSWVLEQKMRARCEFADFPGDDEAIDLGGGRKANLLHLASCALADGRAHLEKVFGRPPLDERRMPDAAHLMRGTTEADHLHEVKIHFIRYILGPDVEIDEGNPKKVAILFNRTKDIIYAAFHDDHSPYTATGKTYRELTTAIRKDLEVEDLMIIHPNEEDPGGLITDYVRVLRLLGKIYDAVTANVVP